MSLSSSESWSRLRWSITRSRDGNSLLQSSACQRRIHANGLRGGTLKCTDKDWRSVRAQRRSQRRRRRRTLQEMSPSQDSHQCLSGWSSLGRRLGMHTTETMLPTVLSCGPRLEYRRESWTGRHSMGRVERTGRSHGLFWTLVPFTTLQSFIRQRQASRPLRPQANFSTTSEEWLLKFSHQSLSHVVVAQ